MRSIGGKERGCGIPILGSAKEMAEFDLAFMERRRLEYGHLD